MFCRLSCSSLPNILHNRLQRLSSDRGDASAGLQILIPIRYYCNIVSPNNVKPQWHCLRIGVWTVHPLRGLFQYKILKLIVTRQYAKYRSSVASYDADLLFDKRRKKTDKKNVRWRPSVSYAITYMIHRSAPSTSSWSEHQCRTPLSHCAAYTARKALAQQYKYVATYCPSTPKVSTPWLKPTQAFA